MTWWVEQELTFEQDGYSLWVYSRTNFADHLFLSWSYHHPAREPILVVVRGSHKQCGYRYIWDTPNIVEQDVPGDTILHRFHLLSLKAPSTIWFYLWAPDGPYGLEIQSPLHRADLSPVLIPPCNPLWTFDINIVGWNRETGSVRWFDDGSPNPGCMELYGTGNSAVYSNFFPSLGASSVIIELERKHIETTQRLLCVDTWGPTGWHELTCWYDRAIPWTHGLVRDAAGWVLPNTRIRIRKVSSGTWRVDTICVRLYP